MALTLALNDAEVAAITAYTERNNIDVLDFVRNTIMPIIRREDEEYETKRAAYWAKIDRGFKQIEEGRCQPHELIEVDDE